MVNFGSYIVKHTDPEWAQNYLPYARLKKDTKIVAAYVDKIDRLDAEVAAANLSSDAAQLLQDDVRTKMNQKVKSIRATLDEYCDKINTLYTSVKQTIIEKKQVLHTELKLRQSQATLSPERGDSYDEKKANERSEKRTHVNDNFASNVRNSSVQANKIESSKVVSQKLQSVFELDTRIAEFATLNYMAFYKFLKKFKKQTRLDCLTSYMTVVCPQGKIRCIFFFFFKICVLLYI